MADRALPVAVVPMAADGAIRLILFGDSWVRDEQMLTWPELLGDKLGWPTINVALPGSSSATLATQADLLAYALERSGRTLHEEAWALVHAGGNDLLGLSPTQMIGMLARLACTSCCCCLPSSDNLPMLEPQLANVAALVARLRHLFGVRNVMLVSMPLTTHMPLVAGFLRMLLGTNPCVSGIARVLVRRLNRIYLRRLERDCSTQAGVRAIALDEASAIDEIAAAAIARRGASDPHAEVEMGSVGGEAEGSEHARRSPHQLIQGPHDLWHDMMHPSQRLHAALALAMLERFRTRTALSPSRLHLDANRTEMSPGAGAGGSDSDLAESVTAPLC